MAAIHAKFDQPMYRQTTCFSAVLLLAFAPFPVRGEPALILSYDSIPQRVRAQNPDLAAARLLMREAQGRALGAGRLANPELETSIEQNSRFREWKAEIGLSQRFPVTNRMHLAKEISLTGIKAAEAEVREVERALIAKAREEMVEVLALRQRRALIEQQKTLSIELTTFLEEVAAKGEGSLLDAGQARIEAAGLDAEMRVLDAQEAGVIGRLKALLGMPPGTPLHVAGSLSPARLPGGSVDPDRRADFQARKLAAEAAAQGVALERARKYDDIEAGLFAGTERREDVPDGYDREAIVGVRLKIPLPLWNRNEGAIEEAQAKQERTELEAKALARGIRLEAEAARTEMVQWAKLVNEIEQTLLPLADTQAAEAEKAFRNGQGELQTVFRSREKRLELATSKLESLRQFHLARVRHEAALGNSD